MSEFVVELRGITKRFGTFTALDDVSVKVRPQSLHAIVGENGAGKTTLMRVLQGILKPDSGTIIVEGKEVHFLHAEDAYAMGISMVSQHYSIIPSLSCIQNLMLAAEPGAVINYTQAKQRASQLAERLGVEFDWDASAEGLGPAGSQKLEILKLLWRNSRIMILDEPTAMLSPADSTALYENLKKLAAEGATILVVTHRLPEVMTYCDEVTILRGGKWVGDRTVNETDVNELAELIVGKALADLPEHHPPKAGRANLSIQNLSVKGHRGDQAVKSVSFELNVGEVVGLAGVDGNGQKELFQAIVGVTPAMGGTIKIDASEEPTVAARVRKGLRLIPEDRHEEGVIDDWPLAENMVLGFQEFAPLADGRWINAKEQRMFADRVLARFNTKFSSPDAPIRSLSGGNQQRAVAARALEFDPKVILAFQPTRGLDIAGMRDVYMAIRDACDKGASALVVSFDLDELLQFCDRVLVMNRGQIYEPAPDMARDRAELGRLMVTT
ncbi:MAG: ABC transporter ATP-binding protein [Armatimonadetes bacterium]|nr:ABC transporter ATP-binding protein [Armatimonadota bacterium]